jgi:hypothetical protein
MANIRYNLNDLRLESTNQSNFANFTNLDVDIEVCQQVDW